MKLIKVLKFLYYSEHPHFVSVDKRTYFRWKWLIKLAIGSNKNYKPCEIFRKKYKIMENIVVVGLKHNGKNVKRRTSGYAKGFVEDNRNATCIYCDGKLTNSNATTDHIIPISDGGNNAQVNLTIVCANCNSDRGDEDFYEYLYIRKPHLKGQKVFI